MSLAEQSCTPCQGGVSPLTVEEARVFLKNTPGWQLSDDGRWLSRAFQFRNFVKALAFVNKVGEVAEGEKHHPDIELGWGYAKVKIQTHKIGGLHENDFILAAKIGAIE